MVVVDGDRIAAVNPAELPADSTRDRPRRRHVAAGPDGHGAQPAHRRTGRPRRPAQSHARRAGRPRVPHTARRGERPDHARGRLHHRAQPRADGEDRRLSARRRTAARDRPGLARRAAHLSGRPRRHAVRRAPRPHGVSTTRAGHHAAVASPRASPTASTRCGHACATRSGTAPS